MSWIYHFRQGEADGGRGDKELLGGKGAGLAEMCRLDVPVPPGFTITTEACRHFLEKGELPDAFWSDVEDAVGRLEETMGRSFRGNAEPPGDGLPLLLSARSGAPVSMPGMMDTVLNLGLNDDRTEVLGRTTGNPTFALDSYRRLLQMYGDVVLGVEADPFEEVLTRARDAAEVDHERGLSADHLREVIAGFRDLIREHADSPFPDDPMEQVKGSVMAVFRSWSNPRARAYRRAHGIAETLGTAVNVQAMVFGNLGEDSASGVVFTRNPSTGERRLYGEFLANAQGEDVVAGTRDPLPIERMEENFPEPHGELDEIGRRLEKHERDMLDLEFTVEQGRLFVLQSRSGQRTAPAAVRIAMEMLEEGILDRDEALLRVDPGQVERLLHPSVDPSADAEPFATGQPASPGAASGRVVFDADEAARRSADDDPVILVRPQTSPDDFHGLEAAAGVLTARGGMTSHAAVVARGMGKPCVVGARELDVDVGGGRLGAGGTELAAGDWITIDGGTGRVYQGKVPTAEPEPDEHFHRLMELADSVRRLGVRANADTPDDARRARSLGAEGIGLCRTEHMFFKEERLRVMRRVLLSDDAEGRAEALDELRPLQRDDFREILQAMEGLPVAIRLLDPPLHEFLPDQDEDFDEAARALGLHSEEVRRKVDQLRETNPMLGHRGVRLGTTAPEITRMQVRALMEAAADLVEDGESPEVEVMVPLVAHVEEFRRHAELIHEVQEEVAGERGVELPCRVGTMIEVPRAALTAGAIAREAEFFSFGTNDLTQTTLGISRDDAGSFLPHYLEEGIFDSDPFVSLDEDGVGRLVALATREGREAREDLEVGICGEHGGDGPSVALFQRMGLDYVSCSPFRVPVARLAAARAAVEEG